MKKTLWLTGSFVFILIVSLFIPVNTAPPTDTRIILEHTYEKYIAPPCFEQAGATNFIEEADLEEALELQYAVHDQCTETTLQAEKDSLLIWLLKKIGIVQTEWSNW